MKVQKKKKKDGTKDTLQEKYKNAKEISMIQEIYISQSSKYFNFFELHKIVESRGTRRNEKWIVERVMKSLEILSYGNSIKKEKEFDGVKLTGKNANRTLSESNVCH